MTIRPHSLRRAVALLLTAVCAGTDFGCRALPTTLTQLNRATESNDERPAAATNAAAPPGAPSSAAPPRERSPEESYRDCLATAREMEAHGKHSAAIEQYERARKFAPQESGIAARLAVLYDRTGDSKRAAKEFTIALQEDSTSADLWNDFAHFQLQRRELDEAEAAAQRSLMLDPDHKRAWVTRGLIEAELNRYDEAYRSFERAVGPAAAHNNLGTILARQGKRDLAGRHWTEARKLDPTLKQPAAAATDNQGAKIESAASPQAIKRS